MIVVVNLEPELPPTHAFGITKSVVKLAADGPNEIGEMYGLVLLGVTNAIVAQHTLDLNERIGFDATTNAALDTPKVACRLMRG